ncbi:MAG: TVP38/TMEM64 family protein [Deltaproteobacteria bacterium]
MPDIANRLDLKYTYPKAMKRETIKFILLIFFAAAAFSAIKYLSLDKRFFSGDVARWVEGFGPWAPLIYISLYAIAPSFMFPGVPLTILGGALFGPLWGMVYASVGATLGASVAFLVARRMGRPWVEKKIKNTRLQKLDEDVERYGWKIVAFTRLIPLFPFNVLNYAFGMTKIRFSRFVVASFVFMLPGVAAYVLFSSSLKDALGGRFSWSFWAGLSLIVILSLIPLVYKRLPPFSKGRGTHPKDGSGGLRKKNGQ